jgi:hypothetical protein
VVATEKKREREREDERNGEKEGREQNAFSTTHGNSFRWPEYWYQDIIKSSHPI